MMSPKEEQWLAWTVVLTLLLLAYHVYDPSFSWLWVLAPIGVFMAWPGVLFLVAMLVVCLFWTDGSDP